MPDKLYAIEIPDSLKNFTGDSEYNAVLGISRLNVFVGPNNVGKSRLMRHLYSVQDTDFAVSYFGEEIEGISAYKGAIPKNKEKIVRRYFGPIWNPKSLFFGDQIRSGLHNSDRALFTDFHRHWDTLKNIHATGECPEFNEGLHAKIRKHVSENISRIGSSQFNRPHESKVNLAYKRFYIPTLRGMRIGKNGDLNTAYVDRTLEDYFPERNDLQKNILTGLDLYETLADLLLGDANGRERVGEFQIFFWKQLF